MAQGETMIRRGVDLIEKYPVTIGLVCSAAVVIWGLVGKWLFLKPETPNWAMLILGALTVTFLLLWRATASKIDEEKRNHSNAIEKANNDNKNAMDEHGKAYQGLYDSHTQAISKCQKLAELNGQLQQEVANLKQELEQHNKKVLRFPINLPHTGLDAIVDYDTKTKRISGYKVLCCGVGMKFIEDKRLHSDDHMIAHGASQLNLQCRICKVLHLTNYQTENDLQDTLKEVCEREIRNDNHTLRKEVNEGDVL